MATTHREAMSFTDTPLPFNVTEKYVDFVSEKRLMLWLLARTMWLIKFKYEIKQEYRLSFRYL
jgi:hypothetical protein